MSKLLLVIDVQNDFINDNTSKILKKIEDLVKSDKFDNIIFTRFINDENSIWYKKLNYDGCMTSHGMAITIDTGIHKIFDKRIYSALNDELKNYIVDNNIDKIYLCGFDTDACISKTALDLFENNYDVYILKDYCMTTAGIDLHNVYINNLRRLIGEDKVI